MPHGPHFEISPGRDHQWRWRFRAANGEIIASGEGYVAHADCVHAIDLLKRNAASAPVLYDNQPTLNALAGLMTGHGKGLLSR